MRFEAEVPRLRGGDIIEEDGQFKYFLRTARRDIELTPEEAILAKFIDGRRDIRELAIAYCIRPGQLNFQKFLIILNRLAAKHIIDQPHNLPQLLAQYLKEGFKVQNDSYQGCFVTDPNQALVFSPEELKRHPLQYLEEIAHKIPLFEDLEPKDAMAFFSAGKLRRFEKGQTLIAAGDTGQEIYILLKGSVEILKDGSMLSQLYAGSVFGESPYVFDQKRAATVKASDPCLTLELDKRALREVEQALSDLRERARFECREAKDSLGIVKKKFVINRIRMNQQSLKGIHASLVEAFFSKAKTIVVKEGQKILNQNSLGKEFFILTSGTADIVKNGKVVAKLQGGDYFGEISLFREVARTADVIATTDCSLLRIFRKDFFDLLCSDMRLALLIESNVQERVDQPQSSEDSKVYL